MTESISPLVGSFWDKAFATLAGGYTETLDFSTNLSIMKMAEQSRIFLAVFKLHDISLDRFSDNVEDVIGIPSNEFAEKGGNSFYEAMAPAHFNKLEASTIIALDYYEELKKCGNPKSNMIYRCGFKMNHRTKGEIKVLWRSHFFELSTDLQQPQKVLIMVQDISHLMKSDFFWFRAELKSKELRYFTLRSDMEGSSHNDILSEREKEILRCLAQGKSTEETAKELFLSQITINNHRQNMLNKIGAKDITALIQLSKMTKII